MGNYLKIGGKKMKKIISLMMALLINASVGLFSSCQYINGALGSLPSSTPQKTECVEHTFNEATLCTTCGYQEFIESE